MTDHIRYIWQLGLLLLTLVLLGILAIPRLDLEINLNAFLVTIIFMTGINIAAWLVMVRGIRKGDRDGVVILMAGIGGKFMLYLIYLLVLRLVTKFFSKPFIIAFFALYLVFTFLLAIHLFKVLKNK
jgi:hypothetical protein